MVSIIIPTFNAEDYLPALLESLSKQTVEHELIIIDSESTDNTQNILKEYKAIVKVIPVESFNHGATRNLGISLAKNDIIIFFTQDAIPINVDALEKIIMMLNSQSNIAMAYGRQLPYSNSNVLGRFARINNYPSHSIIKTREDIPMMGIKTCHCSNSFAAYKKKELIALGGFPTHTILGEDVSVAARFILKGMALGYCAESQVIHSHDYSLIEEFKRYFDIGIFHQQQQVILKEFDSTNQEGLKYVIKEWRYLYDIRRLDLIPIQVVRTFAKLFGYKLGRLYKILPISFRRRLSMHSSFWK